MYTLTTRQSYRTSPRDSIEMLPDSIRGVRCSIYRPQDYMKRSLKRQLESGGNLVVELMNLPYLKDDV